MSENKPNDEPKLSTTDRVVKCKCIFFHATAKQHANMALHLTRLEEFTAVAATNVVENVFAGYGGGRRVLAELWQRQ